jgi:hypothetical protein
MTTTTHSNPAEAAAHEAIRDRVERFYNSCRFAEFGISQELITSQIELLESLLMQTWHEGIIAGLDKAIAQLGRRADS